MELTREDVISLTNNAKRKAVLEAWREWPVWANVPEIGLTVHKLDLPGGGTFTASWYEGDRVKRSGCFNIVPSPHFHLIGCDGLLASGRQAESVLIEELQALRKKILAEGVRR